jgi:hypothetical protein
VVREEEPQDGSEDIVPVDLRTLRIPSVVWEHDNAHYVHRLVLGSSRTNEKEDADTVRLLADPEAIVWEGQAWVECTYATGTHSSRASRSSESVLKLIGWLPGNLHASGSASARCSARGAAATCIPVIVEAAQLRDVAFQPVRLLRAGRHGHAGKVWNESRHGASAAHRA